MADSSTTSDRTTCDPTNWVAAHGDALLRFALARIDNLDIAEDLVQETFLAAWRARESFDRRSSFRTWLVGILRRKIADHYRRRGREPKRVESHDDDSMGKLSGFDAHGSWLAAAPDWNQSPQELVENTEFWDVLARCISAAPSHLAVAFRLRELDLVPVEEICERLDITRKHLSVRLHRARLALRGCLESHWYQKHRSDR